jgi:hypothetical protein
MIFARFSKFKNNLNQFEMGLVLGVTRGAL